ncbi:MAG: hypothetical protein KA734_11450 [Fluviicola sp.]|nr:hypothetical protein [Fluviicola sp.]
MTQALITFFIIIVPVGFAYYLDYKKDKKYFVESLKNLSGILKYVVILIAAILLYKILIPINIENDTELNNIRLKNGLVVLDKKNFKKVVDEQYKTEWWSKKYNSIYFKKVIEYDLFGPKSETDFFRIPNIDGGYLFKTYSFSNNKMDYFIEKPEGTFSQIRIRKVEKQKFNQYLKK